MKALVVYGTKSGCTTGVAEEIGATLAEQGLTVDLCAAEDAGDPTAYDAVIVGSGVRAGSWHKAACAWVSANAAALKSRPLALYTCCLTLANEPTKTDEVLAYTDAVIAESGLEPIDVGLFPGWNEPSRFSFVERTVLKLMKAPEGDFRDFDAVREWTVSIAQRMTNAA